MMKDELKTIGSQWHQPTGWFVNVDDETINVVDKNEDFVVSSVLHSCVEKSIQEHLQEAKEAASMDLLLAFCEEVDS